MDVTGIRGADQARAMTANSASTQPNNAANNRAVVQAVKALNESGAFGNGKEVTFHFDRSSKLPVIQIVDQTTNQVIDQIPAEHVTELAANLGKGVPIIPGR